MIYKYVASTDDNRIVRGKVDVASESQAESAIFDSGCVYILSLKRASFVLSLEALIPTLFSIKKQEVVEFSEQLATLLRSGIDILSALRLLAGQSSRTSFRKIVDGLVEEIQGGTSFSHALSLYPRVFPDTYVKVVMASEHAGNLDAGLLNAALYIEKQEQAKRKTRRAMIYPAFVILMAVAVSILLITVVLPPLTRLFDSLGTELPWMTRWLLGISNFILANSLQILAAIVAVILVGVGLSRMESVKLLIDKLRLKLPLFSSITIERSMLYFCQTASMLLKAGLRLPDIFDIVIESNRNRIIRQSFVRVRERLIQGEGFSQPMSEISIFPPLLVEMVAVGEKSGALDDTLETLADFYEKKVDRKIDTLISMLEPALTVIVGLTVLFLALSIITPMYSILRSMH